MKINAEWHLKNKMPDPPNGGPTMEQRVKWHIAHARHCSCRPMTGKTLAEVKKRYMNTYQEFWIFFNGDDHKALALWAADCAEHVLPYFEKKYPEDLRPRNAIKTLREWVKTGEYAMPVIRRASLSSHAAARETGKDKVACFAARAAGQAVAAVHVPTHAFGAALYAIKAAAAGNPADSRTAAVREQEWQNKRLPEKLREWVVSRMKQKQRLLPENLRTHY